MEHYWGSDDRGEGDHDSDINYLASVNLQQYTTVIISVSNCTGHEHGVFCILIIDLILRSALAGFSMLCASDYYYRKWSCLLCFNLLQSISISWVINIVLIYMIVRYTCLGSFDAIVHWSTTHLYIVFLILNHLIIVFCSQCSNMLLCDILNTSFRCRQINPQPSNFRPSTM